MKRSIKLLILSVILLMFASFSLLYAQEVKKELPKSIKIVKTKIPKLPKDNNFAKYKAIKLFKVKRRKSRNLV